MNGIKMVLLSGNENVPLFQQENETSSFLGGLRSTEEAFLLPNLQLRV